VIPAQLIARIRERTDIMEVISSRCRLRQKRDEINGTCPFHADDQHSLTVDWNRGRFHCPDCGAAGDMFEFVRLSGGLKSLGDAIRLLGTQVGIEVPGGEPEPCPPAAAVPGALVFSMRRAGVFMDVCVCIGDDVRVGKVRQVSQQLDRMLGTAPIDWSKPVGGKLRWLDGQGLAQLDALRRALLRLGSRNDEAQSIAMEIAVLLDPHDDALRQVYADWLQQRGDPRGEFIMLQLADQSDRLDDAGHARIEELLAAFGPTWMAEFTALGAEIEFSRGLPAFVRQRGFWSVPLIGRVRHWTTIARIEGSAIPHILADRA
jgi:uncharacterized protein (TIGR02996 family)